MRVVLAQLAPVRADVAANLDRVGAVAAGARGALVVFPELFASGYRVGDRIHRLAMARDGPEIRRLQVIAATSGSTLVVGAPVAHGRPGEILNATVIVPPDGPAEVRGKRFLPTYGPFEEGAIFSASSSSSVVRLPEACLGTQICYDAFFPEVSRRLALEGAELLVVISAAPVTSRKLFDKVLPARAVENAVPVVYVNRVGVEEGLVFGGGSQALDARGEVLDSPDAPPADDRSREAVWSVDLDLSESGRWRPFRPVLRDIDARPDPVLSPGGPGSPESATEQGAAPPRRSTSARARTATRPARRAGRRRSSKGR